MDSQEILQPSLREKASEVLRLLPASQREALLVRCWLSHDACWFMAVAREYGAETASRLNLIASHEIGKIEAPRIARALRLPPMKTVDDYLLTQEIAAALVAPQMVEYSLAKVGDAAYRMSVRRCLAYEHVMQAGVAEPYECGIFARLTGWFEALGLAYEIDPPLGKCLMVQGQPCAYTITLRHPSTRNPGTGDLA